MAFSTGRAPGRAPDRAPAMRYKEVTRYIFKALPRDGDLIQHMSLAPKPASSGTEQGRVQDVCGL